MIIKKNLVLNENYKKPIVYDLYYKESTSPIPLVIFCHGYKGFKDWGAWHLVAEAFAKEGFAFLKFNFSHNGGTVDQPMDFPDLEAFAENNFSLELDDLNRVINACLKENLFSEQDLSTMSLIGHSRGGGTVVIKAEEDPRIGNVVTWAGVSDFKSRFQEDTPEFVEWEESGIIYVENTRTKQQLPHNFQFYKDFKENQGRFTIKRAVESINIPLLIVHGSDDPTVSLKEAKALQSWNKSGRLEVVPEGDHVFGASHPWKESNLPEHLRKVIDITIDFLK